MSSFPLVPLLNTRVSDEAAFSVQFLPLDDGYLVSGGSDECLKCWELKYVDDEAAKLRKENISLVWSVPGAHPLGVMSVSARIQGCDDWSPRRLGALVNATAWRLFFFIIVIIAIEWKDGKGSCRSCKRIAA